MSAIKNMNADHSKMIGDYDTPEQRVGNLNMDFPWETCMTIANQWAWKPNDKVKSLKECLQTLIKTASGNGNLLFNVGPMADGRIEQRQIDLLKQMGDWLKIYGESIYNTNGGPYIPNKGYSATRKGNKIYIHIFDDTKTELLLPAIAGIKIESMSWMNGKTADWKEADGQYKAIIPAQLPDKNSNVLVLQIDKVAMDIPIQKVLSK
jgi:alpha-L-fucosidase